MDSSSFQDPSSLSSSIAIASSLKASAASVNGGIGSMSEEYYFKFETWVTQMWHYFFRSLYFIVPIAGVSLNFYVLKKLKKIARVNVYRFETSSALPLCAMSICDSLCLMSQFAQAIFHMIVNWKHSSSIDYTPEEIHKLSFFCKIDIFIMHATSAYSVWCWLMLSVLRYTAVFHPFKYRTIWRQPRNALLIIAGSSCTLELWILMMVTYLPEERSCIETPGTNIVTAQAGHLMDILFAYVIPSFIRILLDGIVLSHCYRPNIIEVPVFERRYGISSASGQALLITNENKNPISLILSLPRQSISYKREQFCKKKNSMIMRSLIISALNLCCNLPSHVLRAFWTLESAPHMNETLMSFLEAISQLLYFGQFTCNAFYLSTTIYETSTAPTKTYSTANHSKINVSKFLENEDV